MKDKIIGTTEAILSDRPTAIVSPAQIEENLRLIEDLKFFLATAPANWQKNQIIRRYYLNHDEGFVSCVFWNNLYFITGTDIVRCIVYRFEQFGREIIDRKKFEEGIFSDLRSLKCGSDAVLEASKSPFLEFLYKNSCLRTQKKQKVFFWFSVPHDKIFAEALERDLKKEKMNQEGTTRPKTEPALSFPYDDSKPLYEQLVDHLESKKKLYASSEVSSINGDSIAGGDALPSSQTTEIEPHTFYIKEEDDQLNVVPVKDDDDFPLDYFPIQASNEPLMIDPSVFTNPPDSYDDQYLIEQTYAKTPYNEASFEVDVSDDLDDQYVPVSSYHPGLMPPTYYPQHPAYAMTNGQYYDSQGDDTVELSSFPEFTHQPPYAYYGGYPPYGPPVATYYYEQPIPPQAQYYPAFIDDMHEDGDDELYDAFETPQYSPYSRGFPSFQATAPPPPMSASKLRHQIASRGPGGLASTGRISKPGKSLKHQYSRGNLKRFESEIEKSRAAGSSINGNSNDNINSNSNDARVGSSSRDMDQTGEGEYNSLPTPESTAPDPWHYGNSSKNQSGSVSSSNNGNNGLNDFLEEQIYDKADDDK